MLPETQQVLDKFQFIANGGMVVSQPLWVTDLPRPFIPAPPDFDPRAETAEFDLELHRIWHAAKNNNYRYPIQGLVSVESDGGVYIRAVIFPLLEDKRHCGPMVKRRRTKR